MGFFRALELGRNEKLGKFRKSDTDPGPHLTLTPPDSYVPVKRNRLPLRYDSTLSIANQRR